MAKPRRKNIHANESSYMKWREALLRDPKTRALYEREAAKKERWLQRAEARQAARNVVSQ